MMAGVFGPFILCFTLALSLRGMTAGTGAQFWTDATSWLQGVLLYLAIALPGCAVLGLLSGVFTRYLPSLFTGAER